MVSLTTVMRTTRRAAAPAAAAAAPATAEPAALELILRRGRRVSKAAGSTDVRALQCMN
jgi:hypothetical protein